ncbi:hypothetical protein N9H30_00015 [bacterium]|nr:hypothetical protein [bacterium]|tara:strand:- start:25941 stop:27629 length:1689 start_codon:yes stop_codon:yes gene_type:complete
MPSKVKTDKAFMAQLETRQLWFGTIEQTIDATRMGRMKVYIPDITGNNKSETALFDCEWTSPFAGATMYSSNPAETDAATQTSYGMWMRPPDTGTRVVVGLIQIKSETRPVILSCLFHENRNFMVPGMPSSNTEQGPNPSTEVNANTEDANHNVKYTHAGDSVNVKSATRPKAKIADNLFHQGLADDFVRGQTTSGARREDNSEVFGILTPGNRQSGNPTKRNPGHSFVMDDNEKNNLIRLRTGQGMQFLLNDTHNIIYIINKTGTGYVEIDGDGNIDIFGKGSFNVRTTGDLNLRADQNVNIEAGQDVNIKAANNSPHPYDESRGLGGIVDDIDMALMNPMFAADFLKQNNKGTVNIEGHKKVSIKGKNLELDAGVPMESQAFLEGTDGGIKITAVGPIETQSQNLSLTALGRVSPASQIPGDIYMVSSGATEIRTATTLTTGSAITDIQGQKVDIATNVTPPRIQIPLKASDYIKTNKKKVTLFGYDVSPLPIPIQTQPKKQVQGSGMPTGLGKRSDPTSPPIPAHEGTLIGGVKTIVTRMPQPEPSKSKKDKPLNGLDE